ncbi:MAG: GDP-mannose 4,6-dehydratase [Candidatus Lambdaproteobacteria bacterium]|nr:GDP-mannose 4,6-dehydratase [Candidatus Lambdaproteobacteria bacterium]
MLTGGQGFVGRHVRAMLGGELLAGPNGDAVDVRQADAVTEAVARIRPERVLHLAARSSVRSSQDDAATTYAVNFGGTYNLLRALEAARFRGRLLYVGSGVVYGDDQPQRLPFAEDSPLHPATPYAASKLAAEALCRQWSRTSAFEIVMARPFNHIGTGQSRHYAVADFAAQIVEIRHGRRPPVVTAGRVDVSRDFTDVRDVVRAYELLLARGTHGEVYNVCAGHGRRLDAIVAALAALAGVDVQVRTDPTRVRPGDAAVLCGDPGRLARATGWRPRIPWEQTLREILRDWEARSGE